MSVITIDYLPFDYHRYAQEILPAFQKATEGNGTPLFALLQSATHFSFGPRSLYELPISNEAAEELLNPYSQFQGLLDVPALRRIKAGETLHPWRYLATIIPSLEGKTLENLGLYGTLLHFHAFYTFCCEPPPPPWTSSDPVLPHDEPVYDWDSYCARDEKAQALWGTFTQPMPPELAELLRITNDTETATFDSPRSLNTGERETISGFITPEEAQKLIDQAVTHETPRLASIISKCLRDGDGRNWTIDTSLINDESLLDESDIEPDAWEYRKVGEKYIHNNTVFEHWMTVHPEQMRAFMQRYYLYLWKNEDEILRRMRFAVSRGWGIVKTYHR